MGLGKRRLTGARGEAAYASRIQFVCGPLGQLNLHLDFFNKVREGVMNRLEASIFDSPVFSEIPSPQSVLDTRMGVRFVVTGPLHSGAWEGACRVGDLSTLTHEAERTAMETHLHALEKSLSEYPLPPEVELVEPTIVASWAQGGDPDIRLPEAQLEALAAKDEETDVYVVTHPFEGVRIAERYRKPVIILQEAGWAVDMPARIRSLGLESFHAENLDAVFRFVRVLKAKKALRQTKLLSVTNFPGRSPWGVVSGIEDLEKLKERYGLDCEVLDYPAFFGEMDEIVADATIKQQAAVIANLLMQRATHNTMTKEDIVQSVLFYLAVRKVMAERGANAFTIECFELCTSLETWRRRFTPCLTHALLKDEGYPSVCEGDINVFLAMALEMYLSRKAVYMGNPTVHKETDVLNIHHSVASLKLAGIDGPDSPYNIFNFTAAGFGVTLRHDFNRDRGQPVTVGRFDPSGTRMLLTRGKVIGGGGLTGLNCAQNVDILLPDGYEFWRESQNFGHHLAVVYGDYVNQFRDLSEIMGFELVAIV